MIANLQANDGWRGSAWRKAMWIGAAALELLPLAAMQFTGEVNWSAGDFIVFGALLLLACGAIELAMRVLATRKARLGAGIVVALGFLWLWAELAVGVFTHWGS